jgi:hemoglobin-like flavoprotein
MTHDRATGPSEDQRLLNDSLALIAPASDELLATFYDRLLAGRPELRATLPPALDRRPELLLDAIIALVTHYDRPQELLPAFTAMGRWHARYGVGVEDYAAIGAALIATMRGFAGTAWTPAYQGAWTRAYLFAAASMMAAGALVGGDERLAA